MKNFEKGRSTIVGTIKGGTPFKKSKDYIGNYKKGEMVVKGYLKTHSDTYGKDQYSLYIEYKKVTILLNVPYWYGSKLEQDFVEQNVEPEEYFEGASIKSIESFKTKFNTESVNITIWD